MYHNIKVNVVGPMKSGKSKIVKIIEEATAGIGIVVTEQNDQAQAPPAQENQEAEKVTAGGCPAAPCSAWSAQQQLRKNAARQSAALRKQADEIDKRMSDLPKDMPDYLYKSILWD